MVTFRDLEVEHAYKNIITKNEAQLLPLLVRAVELLDPLFAEQENEAFEGANFYPHDATTQEVEQAAARDPRILSPFTVVERSGSGKLAPVEYYDKYKKYLQPIAKQLVLAAAICENKQFKRYLEVLAQTLTTGNYQKADIAWLHATDTNIGLTVGPYERYLDKLFFVKRAYQAQVGIIDPAKTREAKVVRDILYTTIADKPHRLIPTSLVDFNVQHSLALGGFLERAFFTQQHLPSDMETTQTYGSRLLIYNSAIDYKFDKLIYPIFNAVFENSFKLSYTKDLVRIGNYYYILLRGIAQQLHRYKHSRDRLMNLFPIYDEANSSVSGIQNAKHLVLKGVIDQQELEAIMIAYICWNFSEWILVKKTKTREDYLKGDALNLTFLIKHGALLETNGISWPNFAKMFFELENLATIYTRILENEEYWTAQEFLAKYLSYEVFEAFDKRLSDIKPL